MLRGRFFDCNDATRIAPKLYQGGFPADLDELAKYKFDLIVLAARELQPWKSPDVMPNGLRSFPRGVDVYCAGINDGDGPSAQEAHTVIEAAKYVIDTLDEGKRVLITCAAGRNRSGLITALVLVGRTGMSGAEAAAVVQERRPNGLTNETFVAFLKKIPAGSGDEASSNITKAFTSVST